jgi:hypothetical protein
MKKIVLLVVLSLICVSVFGGGKIETPTEFDPTETPFEGEWNAFNTKTGNFFTYIFTGNHWEYTRKNINNDENDIYLTGLFNYNDKEILFTSENKNSTQGYKLIGSYRFYFPEFEFKGTLLVGYGYYIKQPYGDLITSYYTKENLFSDIVTNENELASIQGSWKHTNPQAKGATYTFSGDKFTVTTEDRSPVNGTVKIKDNILYLIVTDEQFGIFYLDFLPDNKIFLNEFTGFYELFWGPFKKQ